MYVNVYVCVCVDVLYTHSCVSFLSSYLLFGCGCPLMSLHVCLSFESAWCEFVLCLPIACFGQGVLVIYCSH